LHRKVTTIKEDRMFAWHKANQPNRPTAWTSQQWVAYFRKNGKRLTELPWERGADWTEEERDALRASLQDFQLGESSQGRFLLAQADRYAQRCNDPAYLEAMRLFVTEEQRHGALLGRFLTLADVPLAQHTKLNLAFRLIRRIFGLEWFIFVLVTAELIGRVYYRAVRAATNSIVLRAICDQLLRDEAMHIRFHCERLAHLGRGRWGWTSAMRWFGRRLLFHAASLLVWIKHRPALRAGGLTFWSVWQRQNDELAVLLRKAKPESYCWSEVDGSEGTYSQVGAAPCYAPLR
jgi:hypothetical protein